MTIKGWKHAGRDLTKWRKEAKNEGRVKLVSLKKDGNESKLHDATTHHESIEAAVEYHKKIHRLNPGKTYSHHIYDHQNKHVGKVHGPEGDLHHPDTQHSEQVIGGSFKQLDKPVTSQQFNEAYGISQHSEEATPAPLATPVSFVPTSFGSVGPAIQFREQEPDAIHFSEDDESHKGFLKAYPKATHHHGTFHGNGSPHAENHFRDNLKKHGGEMFDSKKFALPKHKAEEFHDSMAWGHHYQVGNKHYNKH